MTATDAPTLPGVEDGDPPSTTPVNGDEVGGGRWPAMRPTVVVAGLLFALTVARRPAPFFVGDAISYWAGSNAFFDGETVATEGQLRLRGVLTPLVYAPAALVDRVAHGGGKVAILVENSILIALIGAVLLPALARRLGARGSLPIFVCAGLTWLLAAPFAAYPLMDLPAAAAILAATWFAAIRSPWAHGLAGLLAGLALNLRPAYLLAGAALLVAVVVLHRLPAIIYLAGAALAIVPQMVFNLSQGARSVLTPPDTDYLIALQSSYATYLVRYDTVPYANPPLQHYCDVSMAKAMVGKEITSPGQVAHALIVNFPDSLGLLARKLGASLAWSSRSPYSAPPRLEDFNMALPAIAVTVVGTMALMMVFRAALPMLAVLAGGVATLLTAAAEIRFALPIILLGIAGCTLLLPRDGQIPPWVTRRWLLIAAASIVVILAFAAWGVSDPLPELGGDAGLCAWRF